MPDARNSESELLKQVVALGFEADQDEWNQSQKVCFYCGTEQPMNDGPWPHEPDCLWLKLQECAG